MSGSSVLQAVKIEYICPPVNAEYDHTTVHDCGCCRLPGTCYYKFDDGSTHTWCHLSMCLCKLLIPLEIIVKLLMGKCFNSSYIAKRDKQKEIVSTFLDYFKKELEVELSRLGSNEFYNTPSSNINDYITYINDLKNKALSSFTFTKYYELTTKDHHINNSNSQIIITLPEKSSANPCSCAWCEGNNITIITYNSIGSSSHINTPNTKHNKNTSESKDCAIMAALKCVGRNIRCDIGTCLHKIIHSGTYKNFYNVVTLLDEMNAVRLISEIISIEFDENFDTTINGFFDKCIRMDSIIYQMYDIIINNTSQHKTQFNNDLANVEDIDRVINVVLAELSKYDNNEDRDSENYKAITKMIDTCSRYRTLANADVKIKSYILDLSHSKKITSLILNFPGNRRLNCERLFQYMQYNNLFEHTHKSILEKLIIDISKTSKKRKIVNYIIKGTKIEEKIKKNRHLCYVVSRVYISAIIILTIIFGLFAVIWSIKQ
jgi:hypothetical protein